MCSSKKGALTATASCGTQQRSDDDPRRDKFRLAELPHLISLQAFVGPHPWRQASFSYPVPHIQQALQWDCGLACALMVLHACDRHSHTMATLRTSCPTTSIWTIDLAHLLRTCGVDVTFFTTTLGARPDYRTHRYYAQTAPADLQRINRLFQEAAGAGIAVYQCSVPLQRLQAFILEGRWLAIVLVDRTQLDGCSGAPGGVVQIAAAAAVTLTFRVAGATQQRLSRGYTGHYLVLCGYDSGSDLFEVRDPATLEERVFLPSRQLDAARRAYGTDEDLLLVAIPPAAPSPPG